MALFCLEAWNEDVRRLRPCYLFHAPDEAGARNRADALSRSGRLAHLPASPHLRVRQATRGEHGLLDTFLRSLDRTRLDSYTPVDADGLIARRDDAVDRFFILLFYAPEAVRSRYGRGQTPAPDGAGEDAQGGTTGSGGVLRDPAEASSEGRPEETASNGDAGLDGQHHGAGADSGGGAATAAPEAADQTDPGDVAAPAAAADVETSPATGGDLLAAMQNAEVEEETPLDLS